MSELSGNGTGKSGDGGGGRSAVPGKAEPLSGRICRYLMSGGRKNYLIGVLALISALIVAVPSAPLLYKYSIGTSNNPVGFTVTEFSPLNFADRSGIALPSSVRADLEGLTVRLGFYYSRYGLMPVRDVNGGGGGAYPGIIIYTYAGANTAAESVRISALAEELARRNFIVMVASVPPRVSIFGSDAVIYPGERDIYLTRLLMDYFDSLNIIDGSRQGVIGIGYAASALMVATSSLPNSGPGISAAVFINPVYNYTDYLVQYILPGLGLKVDTVYDKDGVPIRRVSSVNGGDVGQLIEHYDIHSEYTGAVSGVSDIITADPDYGWIIDPAIEDYNPVNIMSNLPENVCLFVEPSLNDSGITGIAGGMWGVFAALPSDPEVADFITELKGDGTISEPFIPVSDGLYPYGSITLRSAGYSVLNDEEEFYAVINYMCARLGIEGGYSEVLSEIYSGGRISGNGTVIVERTASLYSVFGGSVDNLGLYAAALLTDGFYRMFLISVGLGCIPLLLIAVIIMLTKRYGGRYKEGDTESDVTESGMRFGGASFPKIFTGLLFTVGSVFAMLLITGSGYYQPTLIATFSVIFFVGYYYGLFYIHDYNERRPVSLYDRLFGRSGGGGRREADGGKPTAGGDTVSDSRGNIDSGTLYRCVSLIIASVGVPVLLMYVVGVVYGRSAADSASVFGLAGVPYGPFVLLLLISGGLTVIGGVFLLYITGFNRIHGNDFAERFSGFIPDRYELVGSIVFAVSVGLMPIAYYNFAAIFIGFPAAVGVTFGGVMLCLSLILFALGIGIWNDLIGRAALYIMFFGKTPDAGKAEAYVRIISAGVGWFTLTFGVWLMLDGPMTGGIGAPLSIFLVGIVGSVYLFVKLLSLFIPAKRAPAPGITAVLWIWCVISIIYPYL